ncbi:MAG: hypothetical protein ACLQMH_00205 [Solirubrobacteraceae bacterium]
MSSGATVTRRGVLVIAAAFLLCAGCLWIVRQQTRPHYRLSAQGAIAAARANPADRAFLSTHATDRARVIPLDASLQRVTFFDGNEVVLDAAVGEHGEVRALEQHVAGAPASGAALANSPWILALLSGVFLLATMVMPLRRLRNLDALMLASLTITVPLINARLVAPSVICATVVLSYLMIRCLSVGVRGASPAAPQSRPLLDWLCTGWEPRRRTRLLGALVLATALVFAMITLTSSGYTDVAAASLEGATDLLHGMLPYGHIQLAVHGDTYPLLNYLMYVPGALWLPVTDSFSDLSGSLPTAALAGLLAGPALYLLASNRDTGPGAGDPGADRGLRAMLAWFAFPPVVLAASGGSNDLLLAACMAWMLALRKRPGASMLLLVMGVWIKLVPLILLAIWIPYRRRDLPRACMAAAALCVALTALLFAYGGAGGISAMLGALTFQLHRGSFFAPWYTFEVQWLQPLVQAGVLAALLGAVLMLRAAPSIRTDQIRVSAIAGALLLGVQLAANYWTWSYLPWVFPFVLVALFMAGGPRPATALGTAGGSRRSHEERRRRASRERPLERPARASGAP